MFVLARAVWMSMLAALATIPAGKLFGAAPKIQLFVNNISPGPDNVVTDFTAPSYTGYGDATVSLSGPFTDSTGLAMEVLNDVTFTITTAPETADIAGFIVKDSVLGYLGGVKFPAPITISAPTGVIIVGQNIRINPATPMGEPDVD